jgi:molybdopterin molybdotransferase
MAAFGLKSIDVIPRPSMTIVATGNELARPRDPVAATQIRNSNGPMLAAMARELGLVDVTAGTAIDNLPAVVDAIRTAAQRDLIVLTGGVSMGNYDFVPQAAADCGFELILHKVTQRPGKPMLVARRGGQLLFGLPGNPLSCHFCFHRYVSTAICKMSGEPLEQGRAEGHLAEPFRPDADRHFFVTCRATPCPEGPTPWALHPSRAASSADVFTTATADCYAEIPRGEKELPAGQRVAISWLRNGATIKCLV